MNKKNILAQVFLYFLILKIEGKITENERLILCNEAEEIIWYVMNGDGSLAFC